MKSQDKFLPQTDKACMAEPLLKFFAQEWMSHVVAALSRHGTLRFGQLRRSLPGPISARVLSARLKALEAEGYVTRREIDGRVRQVEYTLTDTGRAIDLLLAQAEAALGPETGTDPQAPNGTTARDGTHLSRSGRTSTL